MTALRVTTAVLAAAMTAALAAAPASASSPDKAAAGAVGVIGMSIRVAVSEFAEDTIAAGAIGVIGTHPSTLRPQARWRPSVSAGAVGVIGAHHPDHDDPLPEDTGEGLDPVVEVPAGAGRIIGSPHAGPQPQQSGDRGGRLQLATLGALAAAVALIAWRVVRASRRARASVPNPD